MQRCLPLLCTGALFSALAHAQCLLPATGTTVLPIYQWSSSTGFAAGPVVSTDDAMTITPIAMTAMANFPMVGALGTLDQIWINSNGELYLTDSTLGLTNVVDGASLGVTTLAEMRGDIANASARIAIFGSDQDVSVVAGSAPDILVDQTVPGQIRITYVDWSYFSSSVDQYTMSCTLYSSGAVQFDYDTPMSATSTTRYVGISIGNNVGTTTTPSSDLSAGADSGTLGLLFESFANLAAFDLAGKSLLLTPNGTGGYISAVTCEPAAHTSYGTGCYSFPSTFAQLFPDQATTKAALDGNRMRLTPATGGYTATWVAGGASSYIAPTGGATTLTYPIANAAVVVTPSVPFPVPGGTAPVLSVSENGIVTASASANNASDTTPTLSDLSSSAAPALAFYSFRDFTLTEVGSGPIQREEVVVGPDTILCLTWNGVEAAPAAPTVNPTTFQFQLNLTTGVVTYVWLSVDDDSTSIDGSAHLVGYTGPGVGSDPVSRTGPRRPGGP